ncbi:MAG TPA: hypothetical protein VFT72_16845 [Opitutaceae bacterium]|nr:hypothetical protein [Opitutaceae bacterium]
MDLKHDEPKLSVNVHHRTTQLNLWMIVAIVAFFVLAGWYILRVKHDPPQSTQEMKQGSFPAYERWTSRVC